MKKALKKEEIIRMSAEEHASYHRRLAYIMFLLLVFLVIGTASYHKLEGWRYLDALYFSSYTITTVGYGDITPKTDAGKIFTIFYMFIGVSIALYGLSLMAAHFIEIREEFWLERLGKIKLGHQTFLDKIRDIFSYNPKRIVNEYEKSNGDRKKK